MTKIALDEVASAGVVGAGGAGFPTHVKLAGKADTVVINAAECEPLLHKDKELLRLYGDTVLAGLTAGMELVGAQRGVVGIKEKYHDVIGLLQAKLPKGIEICPLRDAYPAGDEFMLVYEALGRAIPPGGIPLNVGAVVMNVETALNVARSAEHPVTEKYLTVAGAVAQPISLRVPLGVTLAQCVAAAGGPTIADPNYIVGGVMMGYLEDNHEALVDKTTGGIIVLPSDHVVVRRRRWDWKQIARIGEGLDPRNVCVENKRRLATEKKRWENPPFNPHRAELHMENRKTPTKRLMQKLGLNQFRNEGSLRDELLAADKVGIKLKQHIGAPCEPVVNVGDRVTKGQVLGRPPVANGKPALGCPVHASIDGTIRAIEKGVVWIEKS